MLSYSASQTTTPPRGPIRLYAVKGYNGRSNDICYCPPLIKQKTSDDKLGTISNSTVVYFGGDVQDFNENMATTFESRSYISHNLESTALQLENDFPKSHIIVVRPTRMEFNTFSCFDNFVRGNSAGVPDHTPMNFALAHLEKLLQNVSYRINTMPDADLLVELHKHSKNSAPSLEIDVLQDQETVSGDESLVFSCKENSCNSISNSTELLQTDLPTNSSQISEPPWWVENFDLDSTQLILIGFSKGCVVINQFIYEFHYLKTLTPDDSSMTKFVSRIKDMYFLDGGHGGAKNTWITSRSLLETLTRLNINLHVHVTPYQVKDERRPWIRKEEKTFTELLKKFGAPIIRCLHYESNHGNLYTHFALLNDFHRYQIVQPAQNNVTVITTSPIAASLIQK